jgi:Protein of unknown function (DUF3567)
MEMIYNSPQYCVVEFADLGLAGETPSGGFEIMDKTLRREIFLRGPEAEQFKSSVQALIAREPSVDEVDDFLSGYSGLMSMPLTLH